MNTTREQAAEACTQLAGVAALLIDQLNGLPSQQSVVNHFYKGVIVRSGVHLKDAALLLSSNRDEHISSALIIFRVLLDDLLRSCYVYASSNRQSAIESLTAKAYSDWYNTWRDSAKLNTELHLGDALTEELANSMKDRFLNDPESACYLVQDRSGNLTFKNAPKTYEMLSVIKACPRVAQYARGYILFRQMSHYVHFSMLPYRLDRSINLRSIELGFIDEIMFLTYHMLKVAMAVLTESNAKLTWPTNPVDISLDRPTYLVRTGPPD